MAIADDGTGGVVFSTNGGTFTLVPGASRNVTVTATTAKGAPDGAPQATLRVSSSAVEVADAALFLLVG